MLINVPEIVLYNAINTALKFISDDYRNTTDKSQTFLAYLVSGIKIDKYDFLTQAAEIFVKEEDDPRLINVNLAYNMQLNTPPSIYISLPSETQGEMNIGIDQGYEDYEWPDGSVRLPVYTSRYSATYQIVITSDNSNEVVLIYHVIKSILTSMIFHLDQLGLQNITIGGGDLSLSSDIMPSSIFYRIINFGCQYQSSSLSLNKFPILSQLIITGKPVESL
jgi:hypothetical protein